MQQQKNKFVKSSTNTTGFLSKVVREFYPLLTIKPAEDTECYSISKKVLQLVRLYESRKGSKEATCKKRKKFRERGGGRKVVTLEVNYDFFPI